jgi:hypothetical protein
MPAGSAKTKKPEGAIAYGVKRRLPELTKENAAIPEEKIPEYVLNKDHSRGRHKAIVFEKVLGYTQAHAEQLKQAILDGIKSSEIRFIRTDQYGDLINAIMNIKGPNGNTALVRTGWILRPGEKNFSFTAALVIEPKKKGGKRSAT